MSTSKWARVEASAARWLADRDNWAKWKRELRGREVRARLFVREVRRSEAKPLWGAAE